MDLSFAAAYVLDGDDDDDDDDDEDDVDKAGLGCSPLATVLVYVNEK